MNHYVLYGLSVFAVGLSLMYAFGSHSNPHFGPVSGAFGFLGIFASLTAVSLRQQEKRLKALEERMKQDA